MITEPTPLTDRFKDTTTAHFQMFAREMERRARWWQKIALTLTVHYKDECSCDQDKACALCTTLGEIDHENYERPLE